MRGLNVTAAGNSIESDGLDDMRKDVAQAANDKGAVDTKYRELSRRYTELKRRVDDAKLQRDQQVREALSKERSDHSDTRARLLTVEANVETKQQKISGLEDDVKRIRNDLRSRDQTIREQNLTIKDTEIHNRELLEKTVPDYQSRLDNAQKSLVKVTEEGNTALRKNKELLTRLAQTESKVTNLEYETSSAAARLEQEQRAAKENSAAHEEVLTELSQVRADKENALDNYGTLKTRNKIMRERLMAALERNIPEESTLLSELAIVVSMSKQASTTPAATSSMQSTQQPSTDRAFARKQRELEQELEELRIEQDQLHGQISDLHETVDAERASVSSIRRELRAAQNEIRVHIGEKNSLKDSVSVLEKDVTDLDQSNGELKQEKLQLEREVRGIVNKSVKLKADIEVLQNKVHEFEDLEKRWHEERNVNNGKIRDQDEQLSDQTRQLTDANSLIDIKQTKIQSLEQSLEKSNESIAGLEASINAARTEKAAADKEYTNLTTENSDLQQKEQNAQMVLSNSNLARQRAEKTLNELRPEVDALHRNVNQLQDDLDKSRNAETTLRGRISNLMGGGASLQTEVQTLQIERDGFLDELRVAEHLAEETSGQLSVTRNALAQILSEFHNVSVASQVRSHPAPVDLDLLLNWSVNQRDFTIVDDIGYPVSVVWDMFCAPSDALTSLPNQTWVHKAMSLKMMLFVAPESVICSALIESMIDDMEESDDTGLCSLIAAVYSSVLSDLPRTFQRALLEARTIETIIRTCNYLNMAYDGLTVLLRKWLDRLPVRWEDDCLLQSYQVWLSEFTHTDIAQVRSMVDVLLNQRLARGIEEHLDGGSSSSPQPRRILVLGNSCALVDPNGTGSVHLYNISEINYDRPHRTMFFPSPRRETPEPVYIGFGMDASEFIWDHMRALLGPRPPHI